MNMNLSKLREIMKDREAWRASVHGVTESDMTEGLNNNPDTEHLPESFPLLSEQALSISVVTEEAVRVPD